MKIQRSGFRVQGSRLAVAARIVALVVLAIDLAVILMLTGCATPHTPSRVIPTSTGPVGIAADSGYVYDELLRDTGLTLDKDGKISAVTPEWAKRALGRILDLQEALDGCEAERRALIGP